MSSYNEFYKTPDLDKLFELQGYPESMRGTNKGTLIAIQAGWELCLKHFRKNLSVSSKTGAGGVKALKLEKLDKWYTNELNKKHGHNKVRFISGISLKNLYEIDKFRIENNMSREFFLISALNSKSFEKGRLC